jgi:hypothetical protein
MNGRIERREAGTPVVLAELGPELPAFLSFTVLRGFGASHPLIALADRMSTEFRVPMGPFSLFYDGDPEDTEDRERLEQAWQPAEALLGATRAALSVLELDAQSRALAVRGGGAALSEALQSLASVLSALDPGEPVRLTYIL